MKALRASKAQIIMATKMAGADVALEGALVRVVLRRGSTIQQ